ncbi:unnamed protein product [Auanema sp. JU1783]|nr:unnamed protein product [Auanema sp. JU1783]
MVVYKLTYFSIRGLAEYIRQLFHLAEVPFEDHRVTPEEFAEMKKTLPFEQLPILEVDGRVISQSITILRYLAKQFGYYGKSDYEQAIVDSLADQYKDFSSENKKYFYSVRGYLPATPEEIEKLKQEVYLPSREKYLRFLSNFLKKSSTGFLAGGDVTYIDLVIAEQVATMREHWSDFSDGYPEIIAHEKKVHDIPQIKKWIETRPADIMILPNRQAQK